MPKIILLSGDECLVSEEDLEILSSYRWYLLLKRMQQREIRYATAYRDKKTIYMHRMIMNPGGLHVDHINGNGLDNQRGNLRLVTRSENAQRRHARCGKSGYLGVYFRPGEGWISQIGINRKRLHLGAHETAELAAAAYDAAARGLYGENAMTNIL